MDFFRRIRDSFLDFDTYREISGQKGGRTFRYFILLFTLVFLIGSIRLAVEFNIGMSGIISSVKNEVPEFRLANGELTVEGEQPIVIDGDNRTALIVDTTGKTDESVLDNYAEGVFISKDKLVNKQNLQRKEIKFADLKNFTFDKQQLVSYLPMLKWFMVVLGALFYVIKLVWVLVTTVFLALIGLAINSGMKGKLEFGNLWNIAVYAFTLPWLLEMVKNLVYPTIPIFWPVKWGIAIYILYKGIQAANTPIDTAEPPANVVI